MQNQISRPLVEHLASHLYQPLERGIRFEIQVGQVMIMIRKINDKNEKKDLQIGSPHEMALYATFSISQPVKIYYNNNK